MKTILLTGGGTAGHITPNLALIPYLRDFDLHYAGGAGSMEEELLRAYPDVTFHPVTCVKLVRSLTPKNMAIPFKLHKGVREAKALIRTLEPAAIFSKGGFAALPVMLAASKRTPMLLHESDCSMGLANRLAAKKCRYVCCSFRPLADSVPNGIFTGAPLRQELYNGNAERARRAGGFTTGGGKKNLLIMGGSQGAGAINDAVAAALPELLRHFRIVHAVGKKNALPQKREGYCPLPYCENVADYFAWADCAISRGGANAIAELVALRIPSLIVPLPKGTSRGDQEDNARYYADLGCVRVLPQDGLTAGTLVAELTALTAKEDEYKAAMRAAPSPDGTKKIANLLRNVCGADSV